MLTLGPARENHIFDFDYQHDHVLNLHPSLYRLDEEGEAYRRG